jgi:hypothetical protein
MKLDFSKPIQTRKGEPVRVLTRDRVSAWPVVALVTEGATEHLYSYKSDGRFTESGETDSDLVNVKQRIKKSVWINLYNRANASGCTHDTRGEADRDAMHGRVACLEVLIDCEEGQGL